MKKFILTSVLAMAIIITAFLPRQVNAQSPQAFKYQAVVRDNAGEIISNQNVSFRISIREGSACGTILYQESHYATTNDFGLANLEIGNVVTSDDFSAIDWTSGPNILKQNLTRQIGAIVFLLFSFIGFGDYGVNNTDAIQSAINLLI